MSTQADAQSSAYTADPIRHTFEHEGLEREYFVRLPKDHDPSQVYWGLVVAHGGGGNGKTYWLASDLRRAADEVRLQAIVISPTFLNDDPNNQRFPVLGEVAFLERMLEDVHGRYRLQPKVLLTGYSRGAQFAHRFALWNPTHIQACAPLAAGAWTTPDGRFLMYSVGEVKNPGSYLVSKDNSEGLPKAQQNLFDLRVAKVAGTPASPGAEDIPFLVMCGTVDERIEISNEFAESLKSLGYTTETAWPRTPHGGRSKDEYRAEFEKYSRVTAEFFLRVTERRQR